MRLIGRFDHPRQMPFAFVCGMVVKVTQQIPGEMINPKHTILFVLAAVVIYVVFFVV